MDIYFYFFLFVAIAGVIIVIVSISHLISESNSRKIQNNINLKADAFLNSSNFKISKKYYLNDYATYDNPCNFKKFIAVDSENKKVCFVDYIKNSMLIVDFEEILNYEIYENGSKATTGGNIGGYWSGIFGAETNEMCKELKLIIRLKRYDVPQISYEIINNTTFNVGVNKSDSIYKKCISTLQEVVSFLEVVITLNKTKKDTDK